MTLAEAAAQADALAGEGNEQELSQLRAEWDDELEASARTADFRERVVAYRAIGQFRFRTKKSCCDAASKTRALPFAARRCCRSSSCRAITRGWSTTCGRCCTSC